MPIARRELLGLGAAAALSLVVAGCGGVDERGALLHRPPARTSPLRIPARPLGTSFVGCPPAGNLYYGASLPDSRSLPDWESSLGTTLALHRSYFTPGPDVTAQLVVRCRDDLAHHRLPHVSIKPPGTWLDVAVGRDNPWLTDLLRQLRQESAPIFLTLHHEPENDAGAPGMQAQDYVGMQRHAIALAADLAPNVTVVPVLQHWTFDPLNRNMDPSVWIVREAAVLGVDVYNPWSPTNGRPWRSFGSKVDEVAGWFGDTPIAIGEYGCREDPQNPGIASEWLREAADYARSHNVVSLSYFNSAANSPEGSWELQGAAERTFAELLASVWVTRPV
ncbi:MAG: hypothetical protein ACR2K3_10190 [Nocardioides sp.]